MDVLVLGAKEAPVPDEMKVSLDTEVIDKLIRALKQPMPVAKVGILGDHAARTVQVQDKSGKISTQAKSNAEIGAAHEFGAARLPKRSFLLQPLTEKLNKAVEDSGAYTEATLKEVIKENSFKRWVEKIAEIAKSIVLEGFASNGFGKWQQHSPGYTNNTGAILDDTGQLKNSISSEVK